MATKLEEKDKKKKQKTELPDQDRHRRDSAGKKPTEVPKSAVHHQPVPTAMADDAMAGAAGAE